MIVFDLECRAGESGRGHRFEGWFGSSDDFARQQARGLVSCPACGSSDVVKAVSAPKLARKSNQLPASGARPARSEVLANQPARPPLPPEAVQMLRAVAAMQAEAIKSSTWVGTSFAEDARAMHYGEKDHAPIHGQATPDEARELFEDGIPVAPLLIPVVPPGEAN